MDHKVVMLQAVRTRMVTGLLTPGVASSLQEQYLTFRVIRVGEFVLNPCSLSQSLTFLLETPVLLVVFSRGMQ